MSGKTRRPKVISAEKWFWTKIKKTRTCWLWTAMSQIHGYGVHATQDGDKMLAHRFSWELANGPIPPGLCVLHKCDVPLCVRPSHLFLGSRADNQRDMMLKGRATGPRKPLRHEKNPAAKLTLKQAKRIRSAYVPGRLGGKAASNSLAGLAKKYAVSKKTIVNIIHDRIWVT